MGRTDGEMGSSQPSLKGRCIIPLITLWDFFGGANYGMAEYYRGLQGDGSELLFDQHIYRSRLGRRLPLPIEILQRHAYGRIRNGGLLRAVQGRSWILGGQQFAHLLPESSLRTATAVVFDLLELDYPDSDSRGIRLGSLKRQLGNLRNVRQIVTISQYSKQRIVAHFGIEPERVFVVPFGVDPNRFRAVSIAERNAIRDRLQLPKDAFLILYVGSEQRRKNLASLVRGLELLLQSVPELVFLKIGESQSSSGRVSFRSTLQSSELKRHCRLVEYVAEHELPEWYAASDILVFPSVAEGFGVPCLEAMSCGVPVVTTRCSAIPEVVGDAAMVVEDPFSAEQWCVAIGELAHSTERLRELRERGTRRAKEFGWDTSRQMLIRLVSETTLERRPRSPLTGPSGNGES